MLDTILTLAYQSFFLFFIPLAFPVDPNRWSTRGPDIYYLALLCDSRHCFPPGSNFNTTPAPRNDLQLVLYITMICRARPAWPWPLWWKGKMFNNRPSNQLMSILRLKEAFRLTNGHTG